jgi:antitoxin component of MazEF toxin-antitoxin module
MTRKIVKTGTSLAVTLPHDVVRQFNLKAGDTVDVSVHPQTGAVIVRAGVPLVDGGRMTPHLKRAAADLRRRRARLYAALAK